MRKFFLTKRFLGYFSKIDPTNAPNGALVKGSQNVLIDDDGNVEIRKGYSLVGASNSNRKEIESSFDWYTSSGGVINLRSYDDALEIYTSSLGAWTKLADGFTAWDFVYATIWDDTEKIDKLIFANGNDCLWDWSGGITTFASCTSNTITKQGSTTWAQERFYTSGTRKIRILDDTGTWREFTYTGGENTTTLTGVTPDPTAYSFTAGAVVVQSIRKNNDVPADGFKVTSLAVLNNQLWCGSNQSRLIYISKNSDFTDYTCSSPRVSGEGEILTIDDVCRALVATREEMWIAAGRDLWYVSQFQELDVSGTISEILKVKPIKAGAGMAAQSQDLTERIGDYVVFLNFNNELVMLGNLENLESPALKVLSDPIKPDFDDGDFSGGDIIFHKNRIYISDPANDTVWINEAKQEIDGSMTRFWQPPQILPVKKFSIIDGDLCGHSGRVTETYKLFDGKNDNGNSFKAIARFAYRNYGVRSKEKKLDEWFTEGYISPATVLTLTLRFDYLGWRQVLTGKIDGSDTDIVEEVTSSGSLGDESLGDQSMGDQEATENPKFRVIHTMPAGEFYEVQAEYSTDSEDAYWKLLAFGGNPILAGTTPGSKLKAIG